MKNGLYSLVYTKLRFKQVNCAIMFDTMVTQFTMIWILANIPVPRATKASALCLLSILVSNSAKD